MTANWEQLTALFGAARLLDPGQRAAFLDAACREDAALRQGVDRLLVESERQDGFLEESACPGDFSLAALVSPLAPGDVVKDRYRIEANIASGGQALVYRATDTVLSRPVIVKVMRGSVGGNRTLTSRFEQEMKALSRIDHPGVVGLLDVGELPDGSPFLVIQFVNGTSLREELRHGPIERHRAARLLRELGSALSAAHAAGVSHRDLKPENIMVQSFEDGTETLKLIDFGISNVDRTALERGATNVTVAGTVRYMAPEQFEGKHSTASDVYALSLVACEMLSGYPDSRALPKQFGTATRDLLDAGLAFQASDRPTDVRRWSDRLANAIVHGDRSNWGKRSVIAALIVTGLAGAVQAAKTLSRSAAREVGRFIIEAPAGTALADGPGVLSVSPDGRRIVFAAEPLGAPAIGGSRLWIRPLESLTAQPITAAGNAIQPFWSPDGRFIAYTDALTGALKRIDPAGGPPTTLAERTNSELTGGSRGSWSARGEILFDGPDGALYRVPENGGTPIAVTALDKTRRETAHMWPTFLPDGNRFIFLAYSSPLDSVLYLAALDSPQRTRIAELTSTAEYAAGYLFYHRQGTLVAQRFDDKQGRLVGEAQVIAESIRFNRENGRAAFSVSANGVLAYAIGPSADLTTLTWHDRTGQTLHSTGGADAYAYPILSPDGTRLAVNRRSSGSPWDVWITDLERNVSSRLTSNNQDDYWPIVWSPDSASVVFSVHRPGKPAFDIYRRAIDGSGTDELLFESAEDKQASGFSPDGKLLLFNRLVGPGRAFDIWALPLTGDRKAYPLLVTPSDEDSAVFSPDGRWIAYCSTESGSVQIYAQPFPPTGVKVQLSTDGGMWPTWSADGRTIFYSTINRVWSTSMTMTSGTIQAGAPQLLFTRPYFGSGFGGFATDRAGARFLLVVPARQERDTASLKIVLNWPSLLPSP